MHTQVTKIFQSEKENFRFNWTLVHVFDKHAVINIIIIIIDLTIELLWNFKYTSTISFIINSLYESKFLKGRNISVFVKKLNKCIIKNHMMRYLLAVRLNHYKTYYGLTSREPCMYCKSIIQIEHKCENIVERIE